MEVEAREVVVSDLALQSLEQIYDYGVETFAFNAANVFIDELFGHIAQLSTRYYLYPECRYLATKSKIYRNFIFGSYLIIYRIRDTRIEVLNVLHGSRSITTIKSTRKIKI
jgi:toxin ParE1/3/4